MNVCLAVTATERLQQLVLVCETHFLSSCVIRTSPINCSDDGWRDTFFWMHEHSALLPPICGALENIYLLNYLLLIIFRLLPPGNPSKQFSCDGRDHLRIVSRDDIGYIRRKTTACTANHSAMLSRITTWSAVVPDIIDFDGLLVAEADQHADVPTGRKSSRRRTIGVAHDLWDACRDIPAPARLHATTFKLRQRTARVWCWNPTKVCVYIASKCESTRRRVDHQPLMTSWRYDVHVGLPILKLQFRRTQGGQIGDPLTNRAKRCVPVELDFLRFECKTGTTTQILTILSIKMFHARRNSRR